MNYFLKSFLSLCLITICFTPAQAWKIKFYGAGGVLIENGTIKKICPEKAKTECAVLECEGFFAIVKCLFLKITNAAPPPAQPVLLDLILLSPSSNTHQVAPRTVQSLRLIRM